MYSISCIQQHGSFLSSFTATKFSVFNAQYFDYGHLLDTRSRIWSLPATFSEITATSELSIRQDEFSLITETLSEYYYCITDPECARMEQVPAIMPANLAFDILLCN